MDKISSIYDRINSKCSKQITNTDNLVQSAIANNPDLNQIYNIINDHIYYIYFEHIDSSSKEWESLYRKMEEYLRIKYENKLDEYYHMNCGD